MQNPATPSIDANELAQRRRGAQRTAWLLGAGVALIYLLGFLIPR